MPPAAPNSAVKVAARSQNMTRRLHFGPTGGVSTPPSRPGPDLPSGPGAPSSSGEPFASLNSPPEVWLELPPYNCSIIMDDSSSWMMNHHTESVCQKSQPASESDSDPGSSYPPAGSLLLHTAADYCLLPLCNGSNTTAGQASVTVIRLSESACGFTQHGHDGQGCQWRLSHCLAFSCQCHSGSGAPSAGAIKVPSAVTVTVGTGQAAAVTVN